MEPTAPLEEGTPLVPFVKGGVDPEVAAIKQLLKLLDKAAKSARTYGTNNPVAQRFFQQFYDDLTNISRSIPISLSWYNATNCSSGMKSSTNPSAMRAAIASHSRCTQTGSVN